MKTRDFTCDEEVNVLVSAFEAGTLPAAEFKHSAHIAVGLAYLAEAPVFEATTRMRNSLHRFLSRNNAVGNEARPHPDPLPQGEGEPFGGVGTSHGSLNIGSMTKVSPSPGEEGQGDTIPTALMPLSVHGEKGYHETLTVFWMKLLAHVAAFRYRELPLWQRINSVVAIYGGSWPVAAHYSADTVASPAARESWIEPDLAPLPQNP